METRKKIRAPDQMGFEPTTLRDLVGRKLPVSFAVGVKNRILHAQHGW